VGESEIKKRKRGGTVTRRAAMRRGKTTTERKKGSRGAWGRDGGNEKRGRWRCREGERREERLRTRPKALRAPRAQKAYTTNLVRSPRGRKNKGEGWGGRKNSQGKESGCGETSSQVRLGGMIHQVRVEGFAKGENAKGLCRQSSRKKNLSF